ncbi:MAG: PcfJ domain-containing protein [Marinilabiliaceae bacterium]|nr:PcfJ domain-containing protein [Marinilabiliaceae bacterium]
MHKDKKNKQVFNMTKEAYDHLGIDWVYKAFAQPDLLLHTKGLLPLIQEKVITDPVSAVRHYLQENDLSERTTPRLMYRYVFADPHVKTEEDLLIIKKLLTVTTCREKTILEIVSLLYRYRHNITFKDFINCALQHKATINPFWSDARLESEERYMGAIWQVEYTAHLDLPDSCYLIRSLREIIREGKGMGSCIEDYWSDVVKGHVFIIHMEKPERHRVAYAP